MSSLITTPIALNDAAGRGASYSGTLDAADLPRVVALVEQAKSDAVGGSQTPLSVSAELTFSAHQRPRFVGLTGAIDVSFNVLCQRCLELAPFTATLNVSAALCDPERDDDEFEAMAERFERWDHAGEELLLAEFVDEFIVLGLPLVTKHEDIADCGKLAAETRFADAQSKDVQTPFAGLSDLLAAKKSH